MPGLLSKPDWQDTAIRYMQQAGGDPEQAYFMAIRDRDKDKSETLAAAEHFLYAQLRGRQGGILGAAPFAVLAPGYQVAKALGRPLGLFEGSTPPSMPQLKAGLAGALTGLLGSQ